MGRHNYPTAYKAASARHGGPSGIQRPVPTLPNSGGSPVRLPPPSNDNYKPPANDNFPRPAQTHAARSAMRGLLRVARVHPAIRAAFNLYDLYTWWRGRQDDLAEAKADGWYLVDTCFGARETLNAHTWSFCEVKTHAEDDWNSYSGLIWRRSADQYFEAFYYGNVRPHWISPGYIQADPSEWWRRDFDYPDQPTSDIVRPPAEPEPDRPAVQMAPNPVAPEVKAVAVARSIDPHAFPPGVPLPPPLPIPYGLLPRIGLNPWRVEQREEGPIAFRMPRYIPVTVPTVNPRPVPVVPKPEPEVTRPRKPSGPGPRPPIRQPVPEVDVPIRQPVPGNDGVVFKPGLILDYPDDRYPVMDGTRSNWPEARPLPAVQIYPQLQVVKPEHRPGRVRAKVKEVKVKIALNNKSLLGRIVGYTGEAYDFIEALYEALPERYKENAASGARMAELLYRHASEIDMQLAIENLVSNQVEDYLYGQLGQQVAKANRRFGFGAGLTLGPAM